jgi:putative zinc finger/helix-turn-helix YgiT family protein
MKQLAFCEYCMSESEYRIHKTKKISILKGEEIIYRAKEASCDICGNEIFVSDIFDYNMKNLYDEYRKNNNIISSVEIKRIMVKYAIGKEALSSLLGWDKKTIGRYLDGDMITNSNSNVLKEIYKNPDYYLNVLQNNKERMNPIDYNKSRQAVKGIISQEVTEEKIDAVIKYILIRCEDFTVFALQELLYYVQAFYYVFANKFIFKEDCEASSDGPIFRSVLERYEKFGFEEVNKDILANNKLRLEDVERNVVESIIKFYGCYSGKILKLMSRNEAPWIITRTNSIKEINLEDNNFDKIIEKKLISEYFKGIKEKYNIINLEDIQKYSIELFNKISM